MTEADVLAAENRRLRAALEHAARMLCDLCSEDGAPEKSRGGWYHAVESISGEPMMEVCEAPEIWEALEKKP